jgi:general secretion pathway protein G
VPLAKYWIEPLNETMKKPISLSYVLALTLLIPIALTGCKKEEGGAAAAKKSALTPEPSAERTSFAEVTSQLDPGGDLFLYLSTEQWLAGLSQKVAALQGALGAIPNLKPEDRENLDKAFDVATNLLHQSGLEDVTGLGMSCIARETNFYHSKIFLHHYPGKDSGFLWTMFGGKPHALTSLNLLPASTALAAFSDFDAPGLWSVLQQQVAQSGVPQADDLLHKLPQAFEQATGLKWDQVLASLGGEFGFALTLDDAKVISIPTPREGDPLQIPEPALLLVAKVKDDTIFNRIDLALDKSLGQQIIKTDKPGLKMRTWPLPFPLPIQLRPTVAAADGYLFISTTDAIIMEVLAAKSGQKPGLKSTDEFKHLAKEMPAKGNSFAFVSHRFGETLAKVRQNALERRANASSSQTAWLRSLFAGGKPAVCYAVAANTDQGWLATANGNQHPAKLFALSAVVPAGIIAAIAVPNFVKARRIAQQNACLNNLRQIDGAKQQWALENKKTGNDTPTREDLLPYLPNHKFPVCPAGGTYTINPVSDPPECSHPGHKLPE